MLGIDGYKMIKTNSSNATTKWCTIPAIALTLDAHQEYRDQPTAYCFQD